MFMLLLRTDKLILYKLFILDKYKLFIPDKFFIGRIIPKRDACAGATLSGSELFDGISPGALPPAITCIPFRDFVGYQVSPFRNNFMSFPLSRFV
jgi:hypothetical protein